MTVDDEIPRRVQRRFVVDRDRAQFAGADAAFDSMDWRQLELNQESVIDLLRIDSIAQAG